MTVVANSMRNRVLGPIILTSLLWVVVLMKQIVQEIRNVDGIVNIRKPHLQLEAVGTPCWGWEERAHIVYDR